MEEKDLFDMFREESENLTEQPQAETWQRLETRLATSQKRRQKRKAVPTQWVIVAATMILVAVVGAASWFVTREHEAILNTRKQFVKLQFLKGNWSASEGKIGDSLFFDAPDLNILRGVKTLKFKEVLVENDSFSIKNKGKYTVFVHKNQEYILKNSNNQTFTFIANDGSVIHLRQSADNRFTLSFDEGQVFVYKLIK